MVKDAIEWAQTAYAAAVWDAALRQQKQIESREIGHRYRQELKDEDLSKLDALIGACKLDAKRPTTEDEAAQIEFDTRGWRYQDQVSGKLPPVMFIHKFQPNPRAMGEWAPDLRAIFLWFPIFGLDVDEYRQAVDQLAVTIRHELQHAAQYTLGQRNEPAGLPRHRHPGTNKGTPPSSDTGVEHSLRDIEFHTRLQDEIDSWAAHARTGMIGDPVETLKVWVGAGKPSRQSGRIKAPTEFFTALKQGSPSKWKDAVGKFVREVLEDPMDFWNRVRSIR